MKALTILLTVGVLLTSQWASGSVIRAYSLDELADEADVVVTGLVVASNSFWNEDKSVIYTHYTISVNRSFKEDLGSTIVVRVMGGVVDGRELLVSGNARLQEGEQVLLFLRNHGEYSTIIGMSQGKFSLREVNRDTLVWRGPALEAGVARQAGEVTLPEFLKQCGLE